MIVWAVACVVNDAAPATVRTPVCEMLPLVSVTLKVPPTVEAASFVPLALPSFDSATLPAAPVV